ncbi:MAG: selenide, water dikinase SelD [Xanthomonadaceae bacterium]|nr:selenide, water dikinase SelD [Xanthomonadaceae bacterium]
MDSKQIRLTETVKKGGCAAKLPASDLRKALADLKLQKNKNLIVGTDTLDDAALWHLGGDQLLIQTLDFFTPIVDDPEDFGAIAAANAISDVYAMGGKPITALSILAFPTEHLSLDVLGSLMKGAVSKIEESGAVLAGGHTIDDETLKLGFSVSGLVCKNKAWTNAGAKPGDVLILTKGLGTGTITTALKIREAKEKSVIAVIESMKQLNRVPELIAQHSVNAATDITGFGLAGHSMQVALASGVSFEIWADALPEIEGARASIEDEMLNRAHRTNEKYVSETVIYDSVSDTNHWLTLDPQTSGGLLLSVPENDSKKILDQIRPFFKLSTIIGRVIEKGKHPVVFKKTHSF